MKILFYGGKGWIGKQLISEFKRLNHEVIISELHIFPITIDDIEKEIESISPDRIFCCLGRTTGYDEQTQKYINNIDYLENHLKENINDNLYGPIMLSIMAKKYNKHLSYIGTGCIFSEDTNNKNVYKYTEEDVPDFFGSGYSIVKGYTEQILKHYSNVLNIRIRMPIIKENDPKNFITKIFSYPKILSMQNSMTYLPDMIPIIVNMCLNGITGPVNCVNKGSISHKEIFDMYTEITGNEHAYEIINEHDLNGIIKSKRSNNILSTDKLEEQFKYNLRDIKDCIKEIFQSSSK